MGSGVRCPLLTLLHATLPFADLALYPPTVRNLGHECDYMLSPVSPPANHPPWGVALGTLTSTLPR